MREQALKELPSVDEALRSRHGEKWLSAFPRRYVLQAIRETIERARRLIIEGETPSELSIDALAPEIEAGVKRLSAYSLIPLINATGVVVHTNLGRSVLSKKSVRNVMITASSYSNLEYDLTSGKRGKRYTHLKRLIKDITSAEGALAVNNNAGAVLVCLAALARGKEVIVSRGELVEIGGSFRVPDVMAQSGAIMVEVGTTNKTHPADYEAAINDNTALILKVHRSNYRVTGFTSEVGVPELSSIGKKRGIPVMHDLGSGCLIDLKRFGIPGETTVMEALKEGADIVTFSGDKLLGGPQAGVIAGARGLIERVQRHPLMRALRIDKMTLAALEATLMEYADEEKALKDIPTLRMLLEEPGKIRLRAKRLSILINRHSKSARAEVAEDSSQAGGGALPEVNLKTYAVALRPEGVSANALEARLRAGIPPVIARIKEGRLLLDARTVSPGELKALAFAVASALS